MHHVLLFPWVAVNILLGSVLDCFRLYTIGLKALSKQIFAVIENTRIQKLLFRTMTISDQPS